MEQLKVVIIPSHLKFSTLSRCQKFLIENRNDFSITFELSAHRINFNNESIAVFKADYPSGTIDGHAAKTIIIEYKLANQECYEPIQVTIKGNGHEKLERIAWEFEKIESGSVQDHGDAGNQNGTVTASPQDIAEYIESAPKLEKKPKPNKNIKSLALIVLLISIIVFGISLWMTFFSDVNKLWHQVLVDHNLVSVGERCCGCNSSKHFFFFGTNMTKKLNKHQ